MNHVKFDKSRISDETIDHVLRSAVKVMKRRYGLNGNQDDMYQEGFIAMWNRLDHYDETIQPLEKYCFFSALYGMMDFNRIQSDSRKALRDKTRHYQNWNDIKAKAGSNFPEIWGELETMLTEDERSFIGSHFIGGSTLALRGQLEGLSPSRVSQKKKDILTMIRKELTRRNERR